MTRPSPNPSSLSSRLVRAGQRGAVWLAGMALLAACSTTETVSPPRQSGGPDARNQAPLPRSGTTSSEETRRRASIRLELSANHFQQGSTPLALQEADEAVRIDPSYGPAYGMLGLIHMRIGDQPKAEESFRRALRLDPNDAELNNNYGWFLCQTGRQREALQYFNNALQDRLYATPSRPLHNAGICLMQIGDESGAETYLLRSYQADPGGPVALYNLSQLYLRRGNVERARYFSDRLMSAYQPTAQTLWLATRVARASGDNDGAARLGRQLRSQFPESREAGLLQRGTFSE